MSTWRPTLTIGAAFALITSTVLLIYAQQPADPPKPTGSEPPWFLAVDIMPPGTAPRLKTLYSFTSSNGASRAGIVIGTNGARRKPHRRRPWLRVIPGRERRYGFPQASRHARHTQLY